MSVVLSPGCEGTRQGVVLRLLPEDSVGESDSSESQDVSGTGNL